MNPCLRLLRSTVLLALLPLFPPEVRAQEEIETERPGFYVGVLGVMATEQSLVSHLGNQANSAVDQFNDAVSDLRGFDIQCQDLPANEFACEPLSAKASGKTAYGGVNARVGYRLDRFFAVELQAEYVANFDAELVIQDSRERTVTKLSTDYDLLAATANVKVILPTGRVQVFGLGGVGLLYSDSSAVPFRYVDPPTGVELNEEFGEDSGVELAVRTGGGIDFYATSEVILSLEMTYVIPFGRFEHLDYLSLGLGLRYHF